MSDTPDLPPTGGPTPPSDAPPPPPPPPGSSGAMPPPPPPSAPPGGWDSDVPSDAPRLRSMELGEVIDEAIKIYRANWQVLAGIVAVFVIPIQILSIIAAQTGSTVGLIISGVIGALTSPLLGGAIAKAAGDLYLAREPQLGDTIAFTLRRFGALLLIAILTGLAVVLGLLLLVIPGIFLMVRLYFGSIAVVLEGQGASDGMRRSFELTKGRFWPLLGAAIVIFIITVVVTIIVSIPFAFGGLFVQSVGNVLAQLLVTPFTSVAAVLLYFDLRIRKEAFDLEVLAAHLGGGAPQGGATSW